jgi:putative spermidine/putrescine transport system substrate-binding protein
LRRPLRATAALAAAVVGLIALSGCGGDDRVPAGAPESLGPAEGHLDLVALPGYVEDGTSNPVRDWVTPFERVSGCQVSRTVASGSPQAATSAAP